ncbi:MAG: UbiD family decarboxylase [Desulfobacterales bacterium]|nr:UbiD family decarboxylase [Desulfobacterales bacterium]
MAFQDLREYLAVLDRTGKLKRIRKEVDKDWEIAAVARSVFQRFAEADRPGLVFEKVKGYDIPVAVGVLGASRQIYAAALETTPGQVLDKWYHAQKNPIAPVSVPRGPCKENIVSGAQVDVLKFPIPVWTAGSDLSPYITAPQVCTRDPETGVRNVGTYRTQVHAKDRLGINCGAIHHLARHVAKNEAQGRPTAVAIVIGTDPAVAITSVTSMAEELDEFAVAGALRGQPVELVRCETCDLEVPATAEIVIEGQMLPGERAPEGPFGEYPGYVSSRSPKFVVHVKCITYRNNPVYQAFLSQMPPSESTIIRGIGHEAPLYQALKDRHLPVKDVHFTVGGSGAGWLFISLKKHRPEQVQEVVAAAWETLKPMGKFTVVFDDDIDIFDPVNTQWAMTFRVQPQRDIKIVPNTPILPHDPSGLALPDTMKPSKVIIDATMKHEFPALALPPQEHLDLVAGRWAEYGF